MIIRPMEKESYKDGPEDIIKDHIGENMRYSNLEPTFIYLLVEVTFRQGVSFALSPICLNWQA